MGFQQVVRTIRLDQELFQFFITNLFAVDLLLHLSKGFTHAVGKLLAKRPFGSQLGHSLLFLGLAAHDVSGDRCLGCGKGHVGEDSGGCLKL